VMDHFQIARQLRDLLYIYPFLNELTPIFCMLNKLYNLQ